MPTINIDKLKEIKEYYQQGLSLREISEKIRESLDATVYFFRKHKIPRRTARENNALQFAKKPLSFKIKTRLSFKEEKLKIAALMLYYGEGAKRGHVVDLANSDSSIIRIFLQFLRKICQVDQKRLKVYVYCHSNQKVADIIKYWSMVTKIHASQFSKPYIRKDYSMKAGRQMVNGLVHIRYNDKKLLIYILREIENYKEYFA